MPRPRRPEQRLEALANEHKWFVSGGRRVLWAPEFPVYLDQPGFWDPGTYLELKFPTLLTWALLENARPLALTAGPRRWRPDRLTARFDTPGLRLDETKTITLEDAFTSTLQLKNTTRRPRTLDLVLWARVDAYDLGSPLFRQPQRNQSGVTGRYETSDEAGQAEHRLRLAWSLTRPDGQPAHQSSAVMTSEPGGEWPDWHLTPFYETFDRWLPDVCEWEGGIEYRHARPMRKQVFIALHRRLQLKPGGSTTLVGACRIIPATRRQPAAPRVPSWQDYLAQTPDFTCSDPYFQKYYDYRWYGLRANAVDHATGPLREPCVFEGINPGWFRHAISYSAQILPRDLRWLHDPALAQGCITNFLREQDASGFIHGGLLTGATSRRRHTGHLYHSDWGGAVRSVYSIHPERRFLRTCYEPLARYAQWFDRQRDQENWRLYDVCNQAETGQEYMSRYLFVDRKADEWGPFQLKGVDATVYIYRLQQALAWMAETLGDTRAHGRWQQAAAETGNAIHRRMWDPRRQKFCDVHPQTGKRSPVRALTDFYPFLTDLVGRAHVATLRRHLLDKNAFWTPFPAPSTALDDQTADPFGRWLKKRKNCPWNGRTWLMTNSHIAEVLARAALHLDRRLERYATEFLRRFIHMLFVDRDLDQPTSYEYYNPLTGQAPFFRGTEEYMHSWIIDLLIKYVVGLRPQPDGRIIIAPLDFGLEHFALTNCQVAGRPVEVTWDSQTLAARIDGRRYARKGIGSLDVSTAP